MTRGGRAGRTVLKLAVSGLLLTVLFRSLDVDALGARLLAMQLEWVAVALAFSVVQVVGSAWRWRYTAGRLGIELPLGVAVGEYYLATFLNQVLPGGVVGDVSRAWRHARSDGAEPDRVSADEPIPWRAVHAVVLERLSGQMAVFGVAVASVVALVTSGVLAGGPAVAAALGVGVAAVVGLWLAGRWLHNRTTAWSESASRALWSGDALRVQALTSTGVVLSYIGMYLAAARAVGVETSLWIMAPLITPVLLAMLIPVTVAGWGLREGAAAGLWGLAGLAAADGVTISVAYGLLVLLSSLPGAVILLLPGWQGSASDEGDQPVPSSRSKSRSVPSTK